MPIRIGKERSVLLDQCIRAEIITLLALKKDRKKFMEELFFLMRSRVAMLAMLRYYQNDRADFKALVDDVLGEENPGVRQFIEMYQLQLEKEYGRSNDGGTSSEGVSFI